MCLPERAVTTMELLNAQVCVHLSELLLEFLHRSLNALCGLVWGFLSFLLASVLNTCFSMYIATNGSRGAVLLEEKSSF